MNQEPVPFKYLKIQSIIDNTPYDIFENNSESSLNLRKSIEVYGVIVPLSVVPIEGGKEFVLHDGSKRLNAVIALLEKGITVSESGLPIELVPVVLLNQK